MSVQLSSNLVNSGSLEEFQILRQELKDWEKAVETSNDGRKASREDIKNNPEIGIFSMPDFPVEKLLISLL